ncbi:hypothetical protein FWG76_02880, partial [Candidatus Saccharibacteria bacterium]|nr:hypothetical protein [Candidatus Saccharibacteria bacterium]
MARVIPKTGYGGIYGGEAAGKPEDPSKKRAEKAANDFAGAEKSASSGAPEVKDKTTSGSTDIAENGAAGQHTPRYNSGAKGAGDKAGGGVAAAAAKATPAGRFLSRLRNGTGGERNNKPLFAIGGITGIVAVMFMGVSSLLPIHLIENAIDIKNSFNTTSELRGARLIRRAIGKDNAAAMTTFSRRNTLSANKVAQMNRGLEPEGLRLVRGADGNIELRSAMDLDTGRINTNTDGTIRWDNTVAVNEVEFGRVIRENPGVRNGFNKGARTMKGKTAGWFNRALAFFLKSNALTRNLFRDFIGRTEGNANFREAAARIEVAEARVRKNNVELATQDRVPNDSNNPPADLNDPTATRPVVDGGTPNRAADFNSAKISIDADLKARAMSIAGKASSIASALVAPCSVMLGISAASAMFAAIEAAKGLQVVAAWFEAGQKAKAGAGDDSYYAFGTALTEATVTTVADEDGNDVELHGGAKFTATESAGLTSILVGGAF